MINITNLMQKCQDKTLPQIEKKVSEKPIIQTVTEISKSANDCITGIQQGLIKVQKTFPKLHRYSVATDYFGVYSAKGIECRFDNQMALTWLKTKEQNLENFPPIVLSGTVNMNRVQKSFNNFLQKGFGRLTITDKIFGDGINEGTHTVGLVSHKGKIYILDSLPETYPEIKDCHERLVGFLGLNPKDVVFSNKPQQTMEEYTCNNWTHANLDAVMNYLKNSPEKDLTSEVFDEILPVNINNVLTSQREYTINGLKERSLLDIIAEKYNEKHKISV